ncbi:hypothetical protein INS49_007611 [Diaporthe citri]|uniref:uncharacterized protein n=1 Tax=Diaporthe citri TaxID=83186 RepID=UPI001C81F95A|nr:uncharacterized protein INS49_007611 [Diaporthe citri]KAG6362519.1 hypothetical protein INS49_007611 [Diaporthe citri]
MPNPIMTSVDPLRYLPLADVLLRPLYEPVTLHLWKRDGHLALDCHQIVDLWKGAGRRDSTKFQEPTQDREMRANRERWLENAPHNLAACCQADRTITTVHSQSTPSTNLCPHATSNMGRLDDLPMFEFDVLLVASNRLLADINHRLRDELLFATRPLTHGRDFSPVLAAYHPLTQSDDYKQQMDFRHNPDDPKDDSHGLVNLGTKKFVKATKDRWGDGVAASEFIQLGSAGYERPDRWIRPDESVVVTVQASAISHSNISGRDQDVASGTLLHHYLTEHSEVTDVFANYGMTFHSDEEYPVHHHYRLMSEGYLERALEDDRDLGHHVDGCPQTCKLLPVRHEFYLRAKGRLKEAAFLLSRDSPARGAFVKPLHEMVAVTRENFKVEIRSRKKGEICEKILEVLLDGAELPPILDLISTTVELVPGHSSPVNSNPGASNVPTASRIPPRVIPDSDDEFGGQSSDEYTASKHQHRHHVSEHRARRPCWEPATVTDLFQSGYVVKIRITKVNGTKPAAFSSRLNRFQAWTSGRSDVWHETDEAGKLGKKGNQDSKAEDDGKGSEVFDGRADPKSAAAQGSSSGQSSTE